MRDELPVPPSPDDAVEAAAAWLARRDRGFTPAEQDAFLQWRREAPAHAAALARLEKSWSALDALAGEWRPEHTAWPNPDLLATPPPANPGRLARRYLFPSLAVTAAAAAAAFFLLRAPVPPSSAPTPRAAVVVAAPPSATLVQPGLIRHESQRMTLPDGSVVDLDAGARLEVAFTAAERRVQLVSGEAHFTVTKNPARPFVVIAAGVGVRAVGTAFDVRLGDDGVAVLVTEGRVRLDSPGTRSAATSTTAAGSPASSGAALPADRESPLLVAGQRALIAASDPAASPKVAATTAAEVEHLLAWQGLRLEFAEMPLADVAVEFNRHNRRQLVPGDAATAALRVGGNFRADNVDAFVRLLESSFGVTVATRADGATVLGLR